MVFFFFGPSARKLLRFPLFSIFLLLLLGGYNTPPWQAMNRRESGYGFQNLASWQNARSELWVECAFVRWPLYERHF